jgi:hypothetical protein
MNFHDIRERIRVMDLDIDLIFADCIHQLAAPESELMSDVSHDRSFGRSDKPDFLRSQPRRRDETRSSRLLLSV